jgi:thioredoxin 2
MEHAMSNPLSVPCPHCGALNRVASERLGDRPVCGRCKRYLFEGRPVELSASHFDAVAGRGDLPVLVDFWAPWCTPCRSFAPVFAEAAQQREPRLRLAKVDTEAQPALAQRYQIRSIPTVMLLRHGREVARQSGALNPVQLRQFIDAALALG